MLASLDDHGALLNAYFTLTIEVTVVKKLFLICCLLASNSAFAQWVNVGEAEGNNFYIDPNTIRKDGDIRKVWGVQDLKLRDRDGELSRRYREEYDCKEARKRFLSATTHSDSMASGNILVSTTEPSPWSDIRPNTLGDDILKKVCAD